MPPNLSIAAVDEEDLLLIVLAGELDLATVPLFQAEVEERYDPAARQLVCDLAQVEVVDSAALGALLRLGRRSEAGGRRLGLISGRTTMLRRLLEITRLDEAFAVGEDLASVRAALIGAHQGGSRRP